MTETTYLTAEGRRKLQEELDHLRTVRRPAVARQIHEAKEGGDIMENAGYDEAKNEQAFVEGRIMTLEALLNQVQIISEGSQGEVVSLGSKVTVAEERGDAEVFNIVGKAEADPGKGRISNESPLGRALMGRRKGEKVTVQAPDGPVVFRILKVG
ncbi:MAG: Transcription elongation factor GreA [Chloroflexi bacterium ADurb.Bin180]|nr:MAG: Transcription elongation factor GreA [Chloroflexi bacterium ADurb.Bin180]HNR96247.1 transcription elongation factor GreA [Anaerolineae bacterium]HNT05349.1 transcription elongation factor GreA [Anaerolineae bacterium]HOU23335.1 transcription elongation factor GreA [Anaerolineae bacterium]HQJ52294.1 transcription elongation factor GreA [Anaerolineae bacterium]